MKTESKPKKFKDFKGTPSNVVFNIPTPEQMRAYREREERWRIEALCKDGLEHDFFTSKVFARIAGEVKFWERTCKKCEKKETLEMCGAIDNKGPIEYEN